MDALLRRAGLGKVSGQVRYQFSDLQIDIRSTEVTRHGRPVALSAKEFHLLRYFVEHRGATLSREELLREVWGYGGQPTTRTVDVHVAWLRQKIEKDRADIFAGVRHGQTIGAPIALRIENRDWANWEKILAVDAYPGKLFRATN